MPLWWYTVLPLQWRHIRRDGVSNHQPHDCLLNRLFRRRSKKTSKVRVTGLCAGNSPVTGEFPAQMLSYAENVSIWWRHHVNMLKGRIDRATIPPNMRLIHQNVTWESTEQMITFYYQPVSQYNVYSGYTRQWLRKYSNRFCNEFNMWRLLNWGLTLVWKYLDPW